MRDRDIWNGTTAIICTQFWWDVPACLEFCLGGADSGDGYHHALFWFHGRMGFQRWQEQRRLRMGNGGPALRTVTTTASTTSLRFTATNAQILSIKPHGQCIIELKISPEALQSIPWQVSYPRRLFDSTLIPPLNTTNGADTNSTRYFDGERVVCSPPVQPQMLYPSTSRSRSQSHQRRRSTSSDSAEDGDSVIGSESRNGSKVEFRLPSFRQRSEEPALYGQASDENRSRAGGRRGRGRGRGKSTRKGKARR